MAIFQMAEGGGIDPISQFNIYRRTENWAIGGWNVDITNATLFMFLAAAVIIGFFWMSSNRGALVPDRLQSAGEMSYEFIANMIRSTAGEEGLKYFPFVFTVFFFILASNYIGMIPYAHTTTSHIVVTGVLGIAVFLLVTFIGFWKNGLGFLKLFAPSGVPWPIYILLVPIEVISYLSRPLTLAFRLFANMLAGHIMLKLIVGFATMMAGAGLVGLLGTAFTMVIAVAITALEMLVSGLQAYVFAILTCVYLSDALHPSH
ncbi:MAG: F0F1 ATP synthase subunit A [Pseudomonadota bacterium]